MIYIKRVNIITLSLLLIWQLIVTVTQLPNYILPSPLQVFAALIHNATLIASQTGITLLETILGLILGAGMGAIAALLMTLFRPAGLWLLPVVIISQAIPTFAIAPLFVIWFGYGLASKIIITMIMLFFPVTSSFYDGLRRTEMGWLDLATTMNATKMRVLWQIRVPAALPALASGLRVATVIAPMGAVIGEWVGASRGLGFLLLNSNARMQIDLMFACLITLMIIALLLYFVVDQLLKKLIPWQVAQ